MAAARMLIAEDEMLNRLMTAEYSRDEGFEVVEAWDGDEAARLLDGTGRFDVLFTDVQMPGLLDGIDVALHARRRSSAVPVLVVSGYAEHLMPRLGALLPASFYIGMPYSLLEVVETLNRLVASL